MDQIVELQQSLEQEISHLEQKLRTAKKQEPQIYKKVSSSKRLLKELKTAAKLSTNKRVQKIRNSDYLYQQGIEMRKATGIVVAIALQNRFPVVTVRWENGCLLPELASNLDLI